MSKNDKKIKKKLVIESSSSFDSESDLDSDSSENIEIKKTNNKKKNVKKEKIIKKETKSINNKNNENNKLKMIDLCAGTGAFSHAFESTKKVNVVFANDFEESSKKIYDENFDHKLTLGDICNYDVKKIPSHDILTAGFPCFVAGTKILTLKGYKNIEEVSLEDKLLTHTGLYQQILNLQQKNYTGALFEMKFKYHSDILICTEEHPFYVREKIKIWNNDKRKYNYKFADPQWKPANKLSKNDFCGMVINNNSKIPEFTFGDKKILLNNKNQWFMMGYFVGDGWIEETNKKNGKCENKIRFVINNKDDNEVLPIIKNVLPITDKKCDSGKCKKYGCSDFVWHNILKDFGKYAHGKIIPEWIHDAPNEYIQEFINGYIKAVGYVNDKDIYQITTVSYDLAFGLQRLYLKLGHIFSINRVKRSSPCKIEERIVNQKDTFCVRGKLFNVREQISFIENNYFWFPLTSIKQKNVENTNVYNFEVDKDNSYITENIIVHNCQPFSIAGKQEGFDDKRSNVFWKIVEILKYHKPKCVVLENVKNLTSHDNGDTFDTILKCLKKEKYHVVYKVLNTSEITSIPQNRERIYIVGVKDKKILDKFNLDFPSIKKKKIKKMLSTKKVDDKYYYDDKNNKIQKMVMDAVTENDTVYQFRRIYVRKNQNNECPTLTANMGSGGHNVPLVLDKYGARKLIPRECFNFQGFPEDFKLPKLSDTKLYKLAGNAVSVPVVKLIADRLINYLIE